MIDRTITVDIANRKGDRIDLKELIDRMNRTYKFLDSADGLVDPKRVLEILNGESR
jgi:hypothetical protein